MELLLFTESQIFVYEENMARQSSGVLLGPIKNLGGKTTILDQYFQEYLSLSVQTCLKVRFYQVLHVSVSVM